METVITFLAGETESAIGGEEAAAGSGDGRQEGEDGGRVGDRLLERSLFCTEQRWRKPGLSQEQGSDLPALRQGLDTQA